MTALLEITDLDLALGTGARRQQLLRDICLTVGPGEVHGLVGESGAGKSMIARVILGIAPGSARITRGTVHFIGQDITHLAERRRRRLMGRGLALIPQDPMTALNPGHRIGRQITSVLRLHLQLDRRQAAEHALALMEEVRIREPERVLRQYPHELSGGMRQRVLIAIAFACRPKLIIADEPTTALDVTVQRQILRLIRDLQRTAGTSILFITHDLGVVAKLCDSVSVMHGGRILEQGSVSETFAAPQHPYTVALLHATPRYDRPAGELRPVPEALTAQLLAETRRLDHAGAA